MVAVWRLTPAEFMKYKTFNLVPHYIFVCDGHVCSGGGDQHPAAPCSKVILLGRAPLIVFASSWKLTGSYAVSSPQKPNHSPRPLFLRHLLDVT